MDDLPIRCVGYLAVSQLAKGTPRHPEEDKQKNCNSRWSQDEGGEFLCDVWVARLQRPLEIAITVYKDTEPLSKTFKV
ncbi:unnamed protein product [Brassica rapa]|uniref:Uncharacterized protein n=2 Tax=Brassica TaxID=3705 RepID=A0A8D9HDI8_BRACM|nr:unnamed protein product [Brassica napus]CAG7897644.1 unnamed protein product [Brassica rapa]